jgi:hypothetical protein
MMSWVRVRSHRRSITAIALLGVAFYALLLPGHLISQFAAQLHRADLGMFADSMCSPGSSKPAMPESSCPICKGLAAFQLALVTLDAIPLPVLPHATPTLAALREHAASAALPATRSRGPPPLQA